MADGIEQFTVRRFIARDYDGAEFITLPADPYAGAGQLRILVVTADAPQVFTVPAALVTTDGEFVSACYAWLADQKERAALNSVEWLRGGEF